MNNKKHLDLTKNYNIDIETSPNENQYFLYSPK